jgi:very-short-patch-repair endonuclease
MKRLTISAERQELVSVKKQNYFLDFAIYCSQGKVDVEADGDTWHANPEKAEFDNRRDNAIEVAGWKLLRYNTRQIREQMAEYCIPEIAETINSLGGLDEGVVPRKIDLHAPGEFRQLGLFDNL